ncbi:unnamed protein product [Meganyctiphanes norvegica]|uniref:Uncharacterized protein n=1 Tax=Meganyctiphanes norvegica TaxID=48144 RepID=A0AAV2SF18_MEGNR
MQAPTIDMIKGVKSQLKSIMDAPIGSQLYINIYLRPILGKLAKYCYGCNRHRTAFHKLFNWLVNPKRTVEEFNYVIGPLGYAVSLTMDIDDGIQHQNADKYSLLLG